MYNKVLILQIDNIPDDYEKDILYEVLNDEFEELCKKYNDYEFQLSYSIKDFQYLINNDEIILSNKYIRFIWKDE